MQNRGRPKPGGTEVILLVRDVRDILPWVMSWGAGVRIQEPPVLRELIHEEAQKILLT
ncbi:WYL domain-containing protein [Deinococcus piscis]|uniref:WYL domain-containing protein n=1 Tax=Deinococcus piscis TaxID=394230 RepID=UPI003571755E